MEHTVEGKTKTEMRKRRKGILTWQKRKRKIKTKGKGTKIEVRKKQKKSQLFHFPGRLKSALKIGNSGVP